MLFQLVILSTCLSHECSPANNCTKAANECDPSKTCNVCTECCKPYIPDGTSCDNCVKDECKPSPPPSPSPACLPKGRRCKLSARGREYDNITSTPERCCPDLVCNANALPFPMCAARIPIPIPPPPSPEHCVEKKHSCNPEPLSHPSEWHNEYMYATPWCVCCGIAVILVLFSCVLFFCSLLYRSSL
jgi:hypothetical protein